MPSHLRFADRVAAGKELAQQLLPYAHQSPLVLGFPRGGVPVASEVARRLLAPLDIWIVRKIGAPLQPELGLGAVAEGGEIFVDEQTMALVGISRTTLQVAVQQKLAEVKEQVARFRRGRPPPFVHDRTVLVIDDGAATGATIQAAVRAIRKRGPRSIVLALPVASSEAAAALGPQVDDLICLYVDPNLRAVGEWYQDFAQTSEPEVIRLLDSAQARPLASHWERPAPH